MLSRRLVSSSYLGTIAAVVATTAIVTASGAAQKGESQTEKKRQERIAVLDEIAKLEQAAFQSGETPLTSVLLARGELLEATLEMTKLQEDRIAVLKEHAAVAKQLEAALQEQVNLAQATRVNLLKAKAARLKVEAACEEAQLRPASH